MKIRDFAPLLASLDPVRTQERPVLVVTHERPDGDAVGSSTALCLLLKENGFRAELYLPDEIPDCYLTFLPPSFERSLTTEEINRRYSLVFNADASTVKRLGLGPASFSGLEIPVLTIDHHPDNEGFGAWSYVDPSARSASELVYRFALFCGWTVSKEAATRLLLGLTTDTGCFRFANTTPEVHRAAAGLIALGADNAELTKQIKTAVSGFSVTGNVERLEKALAVFTGGDE